MATTQVARSPRRFGWWALVPLSLAAVAVTVPYLWMHGLPVAAFALKRGFAVICHQRPERSLWIFGAPVAVCARCLGIYVGAAAGLLLRASRRVAIWWLVVAAMLNAADAVTELAGWHGNRVGVRFALGIGLGAATGALISSAMAEVPPYGTRVR